MLQCCELAHLPNAGEIIWVILITVVDAPAYLIVETAFGFQEVKEFSIGLTSPELHICDLEIAPIWNIVSVLFAVNKSLVNSQWQRL